MDRAGTTELLIFPKYTALFTLLGTNFGGTGSRTFVLPDLGGRVLAGADGRDPDQGPGGLSGRKSEDAELIPYTAINWAIAADGRYPPRVDRAWCARARSAR